MVWKMTQIPNLEQYLYVSESVNIHSLMLVCLPCIIVENWPAVISGHEWIPT